jgi:hypothetical protein
MGAKRDIQRIPFALSRAGFFTSSGSGIVWRLVRRKVEDGVIAPEDVLRSVPVVHIPVDDQYRLDSVFRLRVPRCDRGIVEQTKTHRLAIRRVVTRRSYEREGASAVFRERAVHGRNSRSRGETRDVVRLTADDRVRIDESTALVGDSASCKNHVFAVASREIFVSRNARRQPAEMT